MLTGPAAAALYGSSAANGVILINTKKGQEGKLKALDLQQYGVYAPVCNAGISKPIR